MLRVARNTAVRVCRPQGVLAQRWMTIEGMQGEGLAPGLIAGTLSQAPPQRAGPRANPADSAPYNVVLQCTRTGRAQRR